MQGEYLSQLKGLRRTWEGQDSEFQEARVEGHGFLGKIRGAWTPERGHYQTVLERGIRGASVVPCFGPQRPRCPRTSSPRPIPRPTCWCAGSHRLSATETSPTTWCCGSVWRRTATSISTTTATAVRRAAAQAGGSGRRGRGAVRLTASFPRRRARLEAAHQQQRPPLRPRRRGTGDRDGAWLLPLPAHPFRAGPAAAGGARGLVSEEVRKLPAQRHHHPQVRPDPGAGRAWWARPGRSGSRKAGVWAGPDPALPGLPRSPWKVTSIHKSPQR